MDVTYIIGERLDLVLRALAQNLPESQMSQFERLNTDRERLDFVLRLPQVHDTINFEAEYAGKSAAEAKKFKEEGNRLFGKKSYRSAVEMYNKALMHVPQGSIEGQGAIGEGHGHEASADLALIVANRSATLLHLQLYDLCLQDIDLAIAEGYPVNMTYKLLDRKGKCHLHLGHDTEARASFKQARQSLGSAKLDEKGVSLWVKTLDKQLKQCGNAIERKTREHSDDFRCPPKLSTSRSDKYPSASKAVDVKYDANNGRYTVATQNVHVGDVLMSERPFVCVLLPRYYGSHCYHCQARVKWIAVPCYKCSDIIFCNSQCRDTAWEEYHRLEYRFRSLLTEDWCGKIGHLALRLAVKVCYQNIRNFMLSEITQIDAPEPLQKGMNKEGIYESNYSSTYHMEVNDKKRLPEGRFDFTIYSVFLLKILQKSTYFANTEDASNITIGTKHNEDLVLVGTALMKNLSVIQCNAFGIIEIYLPSDFENPSPKEVAMGVYPTASLINHSCNPNVDVNFYRNQLIVRATRNINQGDSVNIDYGVTYYENHKAERQRRLQYRYCFQCECTACEEGWLQWRDIEAELPSFKCDSCHRELPMGGKLIENTSIRCSHCNTLQNIQEIIGHLQVQHDRFAAGLEAARAGKIHEALPSLQDYLVLMQSYILPPWRDMVSCQAAVKQCYRLMANVRT